ncbi:HNH endonuclease [Microbacterium azadirachtae]|uniref:HNH endonuclease n=1 Tax=Microbacterium azadirachtae TaxID=582680 RepID=A0A0F0LGW7_9MICO|nr:HNH endonuclease signature motif containing protein [Microbacterium azadirachtae]KJL31909.1 HNH endonuclease [Microbacterium azadirachtae]
MANWLSSADLHDLASQRWGHRSTWTCTYCGRSIPDGAVDHFIPREHGGTDLPWNLLPACGPCNRSKSDTDPIAWMRAVGLPDDRITAIQTITTSPDWTKAAAGHRAQSLNALDYSAAFGLPQTSAARALALALPQNLAEVFVLDPASWAPATALRRIAVDYLADLGHPPLSTQQLNRDLESRGLVRTTRKGVRGYRGFHVSPDLAAAGRMRAGRTDAAAARKAERARREAAAEVARMAPTAR